MNVTNYTDNAFTKRFSNPSQPISQSIINQDASADAESFIKYKNIVGELFPEESYEDESSQMMMASPLKGPSPLKNQLN